MLAIFQLQAFVFINKCVPLHTISEMGSINPIKKRVLNNLETTMDDYPANSINSLG